MVAETLRWWLVVEAIGLIALPIVYIVFQRLPGRGIAFAKPAGLLLIGYLFWLALSLHILPNRPGSIAWVALPVALVSFWIVRKHRSEMQDFAQKNLGYILAVEVVYFFGLLIAAHIRSFLPEIGGTEKPMDFLFLNAASHSRYYTPDDPWLSGFGVSYYYFGYVINAMIGKLAAVPTSVAFNLAVASTAALAATTAYGLGYEIARLVAKVPVRAAFGVAAGAVLLLAVIGNLEGVIEFGVANGVVDASINDSVQINDLETARVSNDCLVPSPFGCVIYYPSDNSSFWWWWRSTRISPDGNSITEFPFFSFILGDLHPHVMAIPFVLTVLGLALSMWAAVGRLDFEVWKRNPWLLLMSAVLLGGLGFLNTWDLPTFGFLLTAIVLARNYLASKHAPVEAPAEVALVEAQPGEPVMTASAERDEDEAFYAAEKSDRWLGTAAKDNGSSSGIPVWLRDTATFVGPLIVLAALLYVPFYASFSSQASGFATVLNGGTRPLHSALFWGVLVTMNLPLPLVLLTRGGFSARRGDLLLAISVPVLLLLAWAALTLVDSGGSALFDAISARGWNWFTYLFFATGLGAALLALRRQFEPHLPVSEAWDGTIEAEAASEEGEASSPFIDDSPALTPVLIIMCTGLLLILGAELFYVKDVFGSRLNTVFKLSYQAWLLLAISGAYSLWWLRTRWQPTETGTGAVLRGAWGAAALLVVLGGLIYPISATLARTDGLSNPKRTLDGLQVAKSANPDDYAAINWLSDRAGQNERIMEGTGGQYSAAGRVSSATGIPTVIGWLGHEVQWGRNGATLTQRENDVDTVYSTTSMEEAMRILQQYQVTYVFVGSVERAKYPADGLEKFESALPVAFESGDSAIFRVPKTIPENSSASTP